MASFYPEVYDLQPWLHDFTKLGLQTHFATHHTSLLHKLLTLMAKSSHSPLDATLHPLQPAISGTQQRMETSILPYIQHCLLEMPGHTPLRCVDLFCADGYFTCMLANMRMGTLITGLDADEGNIRRAKLAAKLLNLKQTHFLQADAADFIRIAPAYDLVLCLGGLIYQSDPCDFLRQLHKTGSQYLILQNESVPMLHFQDANIHKPGTQVGQQGYYGHLEMGNWLTQTGWQILENTSNEPINESSSDGMNSSYYRCKAAS